MEQEEEAKRLDSPVMKIFLFSCGFFFLFWFLSLIFQTENFWNILGFESKVASFVYFVISLVVFMIVYSQTKKGNVNNLLNKIYSSKKATLILVAITIAIIVFYTASLKIGENWATLIIRSITGLCAGGPLQALQFKYFTSSPLASSVGVLVGQIGLALKVNTLVSLKILSKIIGIIFVFVAYYFVRKHYPKQTFPTLFIILFSIGIASFLGVAGHVNFIGIVFILLYFGSAYLCLKNKANIIVPSVLLAMSMLSHLSTRFFLPSLLYLLVHDKINFKKGTINKRIFKDLLFVIVGLAIPYLIFYAAVQIDVSQQGFNVLDLGAGDLPNEGNGFAPLTKAGVAKYGAHYTMFAPLHFIDFLSFSQLMNAFKFIFVLLAPNILKKIKSLTF